jgi:DNA-binding CsgD family transcriptional regulator/tetratricopeptide (TPR) repeat protein
MTDVALRGGPIRVVGRKDQLDDLAGIWTGVQAGRAATVLVGGDAGVGKTTLIDTFVARHAGGARVIRGQCVPLGGDGLGWAPVIGALRDLRAQTSHGDVAAWAGPGAPAIGCLLPEYSDLRTSDGDRLRTLEAVTAVFEHAAADQPTIVVVEDIHWADGSTRDWIGFATRAVTDAPLMLVASYRTDELHRRHPLRPFLAELDRLPQSGHVDVPRLDRADVAELLGSLLPSQPDTGFVDEIFSRSDGIPFFVEELASTDCCDLPSGLRNVLIIRFEGLSQTAQDTVRLVAVAGNQADHRLIAAVSELSGAELDGAIREAVDGQLLVADDHGYRFRHALLREAILDDLLPGERMSLHRRFATTMERRTDLDAATRAVQLAHHWYCTHDLVEAFRWSREAAVLPGSGRGEALSMYERMLELWPQVPNAEDIAGPRVAVLEAAADIAHDAGELLRSLSLCEAALAETDFATAPLDAARLLEKKGQRLAHVMLPGSVETLQHAVALVPPDPPSRQRADTLAMLAAMQMLTGDHAGAIVHANQAVAAARAAASPLAEASALVTLGASLSNQGHIDEGLRSFELARDMAAGDDHLLVRVLINWSDVLHLNGRYREAHEVANSGRMITKALGVERTKGAMMAGNSAEPLFALGEWDRARQIIDRTLELDPPAHHRIHNRLLQAWHLTWTDQLAAADRGLAEFRPMLQRVPTMPQYLSMIALGESEYGLAIDDAERAWQAAKVSLELRATQNTGAVWWVARAAAAAIATRRRHLTDAPESPGFDPDGAEELVRASVADFNAVAGNAVAEALIEAELACDITAWERAAKALDGAEGPVRFGPYTMLRRAELLASTDRAEAAALLRSAADSASALGAIHIGRHVRELARRLGVRLDSDADPDDGRRDRMALTSREQEVLRLVAEGRTNGEIGAELFITTKTASVHVSNILAKLGVSSRTEAAAVAHRLGQGHGLR